MNSLKPQLSNQNRQQGATAEAYVAYILADLGYTVLMPLSGAERYDMAVRLYNGRTLYLQIKSSRIKRVQLRTRRSTPYNRWDFDYYVAVLAGGDIMMIGNTEHAPAYAVFTPTNLLSNDMENTLEREEARSD